MTARKVAGVTPFWSRLGVHDNESEMPMHFPIGVNASGDGPMPERDAHHDTCWCGNPECPLSVALTHAWQTGRRCRL